MTMKVGGLSIDPAPGFAPILFVLQGKPEKDGIAPTLTIAHEPVDKDTDLDVVLGAQLNTANASLPAIEVEARTRIKVRGASCPAAEFAFDGPVGRMRQIVVVMPAKGGAMICSGTSSSSVWSKHKPTLLKMIESAQGS